MKSALIRPKTKAPSLQGGNQYADARQVEMTNASQSTGRFQYDANGLPSDAVGPGGMLKYKVVGKSASQSYLNKHRNTQTVNSQ